MYEFKKGDEVYYPKKTNMIIKIIGIDNDTHSPYKLINWNDKTLTITGKWNTEYLIPDIYLATKENYDLLSKLHPYITFQEPKLKGNDLVNKLLTKGKAVFCTVSSISQEKAYAEEQYAIIIGYNKNQNLFISNTNERFSYVNAITKESAIKFLTFLPSVKDITDLKEKVSDRLNEKISSRE